MGICDGKISKNFLRDCAHRPKSGLKNTVHLMNTDEIDKAATQMSASKMTVNTLVLGTAGKIYNAEGAGKYPVGNTEIVKADNGNGWKHGLTVRILYYGDEQREQVKQMVNNGRISAIIEKKDGGLNGELTYDILGYESGMAVQSATWNSNENDGVVELVLGTEEDELEATDRKIFMMLNADTSENDLAATKAWINTNTAV